MTDQPRQVGGSRHAFSDIAPKLAALTDVHFATSGTDPSCASGDRSLITGTALIAGGHPDRLQYHLARALEAGVTRAELIEPITPSGVLHRLAQRHVRRHQRPRGLRHDRHQRELSGRR